MKIISKEESDGYFFVTYEMDRCFSLKCCSPGLLLLYTITERSGLEIQEITLDYYTDIHEEGGKQIYNKDGFLAAYPSAGELCRNTEKSRMGPWTVELSDGTVINGEQGSEIRVMYEDGSRKWNKAFLKIEAETFHYNDCPPELVDYLEKTEQMSEALAVEVIQALAEQEDLFQEFFSCVRDGKYIAPADPIAVEGYTAKRLIEEVGFRPVGAYRSLVWLRLDPQRELNKIKEGIIRK